MERYRKSIGIICATIICCALLISMIIVGKPAIIGISLGVASSALMIGAAWGLNKK